MVKTQNKRVAVIGSGIGGLSAAILLASQNYQVDVYENQDRVGGKARGMANDGLQFDSGPSVLTLPEVFESLFQDAGEDFYQEVKLTKLDNHFKSFFPDDSQFNAWSELSRFQKEWTDKRLSKQSAIKKYLRRCRQIYKLTVPLFVFSPVTWRWLLRPLSWKALFFLPLLETHKKLAQRNAVFKDPRARQFFNRFATYNGSSPYSAPATLQVIAWTELGEGGSYLEGGILSLVKNLEKLAQKKGVQFHLSTGIQKIIKNKRQKRVEAIETNAGEIKNYDALISNVDVLQTYHHLLGEKKHPRAVKESRKAFSSSALVYYWGLSEALSDLELHNLIFSNDYQKEFEQIFNEEKLPENPSIYIYDCGRLIPSERKDVKQKLYVMVNAPKNTNQKWDSEKENYRKIVIDLIEKRLGQSLKEKIVTETILTPADLEKQTGSFKGSLYGPASHSPSSAFLRHQAKVKPYKNLFLCGGSAHPGGGLPLTALSGRFAADACQRFFDKKFV